MDNNKQSVHYLQKKITELTQQYYEAIRNNITFENLKAIFMKGKDLEKKLSDMPKGEQNISEVEANSDNVHPHIKINNNYDVEMRRINL